MLFGILNIYKSVGMTSHDVIAILRKKLGIKQIGHTGTLDPFAEGVLPVCVGKATRLIEYLADNKEYLATVQFGASTTTYDKEGKKIFISDKKTTEQEVKNNLETFEGDIEQLPPIYSAIKVKGKKLYEYARKGEDVKIEPRKVFIESIELESFDEILQQAKIKIKCSKGTYIRSIANDLGKNLGTGGYLTKLVRTQVGNLFIEDSINLENPKIINNLINPIKIIDLPKINVTEKELENISHGKTLTNYEKNVSSDVLLVYNNDEICAVGYANDGNIKLKKVFI